MSRKGASSDRRDSDLALKRKGVGAAAGARTKGALNPEVCRVQVVACANSAKIHEIQIADRPCFESPMAPADENCPPAAR